MMPSAVHTRESSTAHVTAPELLNIYLNKQTKQDKKKRNKQTKRHLIQHTVSHGNLFMSVALYRENLRNSKGQRLLVENCYQLPQKQTVPFGFFMVPMKLQQR